MRLWEEKKHFLKYHGSHRRWFSGLYVRSEMLTALWSETAKNCGWYPQMSSLMFSSFLGLEMIGFWLPPLDTEKQNRFFSLWNRGQIQGDPWNSTEAFKLDFHNSDQWDNGTNPVYKSPTQNPAFPLVGTNGRTSLNALLGMEFSFCIQGPDLQLLAMDV